jgi:hypothetical protein
MRMLERRIARLERALVIRRLLARLRQSRRDIEVLERRRREAAKAQAAAAPPPQPRVVSKPVVSKPVAEPAVPRVPVVAEAQPPPVESRAVEAEPAPAWPNYDPPEHMQIRPIRWVPPGERYVDDEKPRHPADEEYDPFAEFDAEA